MRKEEFSTLPKLVQQYLVYIEAIKGHSEKSVLEYASDLRTFFRYIVKLKGLYSFDTEDEKIDLSPIDLNFIQSAIMTMNLKECSMNFYLDIKRNLKN